MRILHVINHTARLNGNVHAAVDLACAQAKLGHDVFMCSEGGDFDETLSRSGVSILTMTRPRAGIDIFKSFLRVCKSIFMYRPDVVHAHMPASAVVSFISCLITGRPLITTVHNSFDRQAVVMKLGRRVITVSNAVLDEMARKGIPKSKMRTVLNGTIGSARFEESGHEVADLKSYSILSVGGLHERKGIGDLIKAFDLVFAEYKSVNLYIVGEGPSEPTYRELASNLRCAEAIHFVGALEDPRPYLQAADIFVLPSLADPAPLVLSEAREAGCAIIASKVGGVAELLEQGRAGILVDPKNIAELADKILYLISDELVLKDFKERSQYNIGYLSLDRVAEETLDVYREACLTGV